MEIIRPIVCMLNNYFPRRNTDEVVFRCLEKYGTRFIQLLSNSLQSLDSKKRWDMDFVLRQITTRRINKAFFLFTGRRSRTVVCNQFSSTSLPILSTFQGSGHPR